MPAERQTAIQAVWLNPSISAHRDPKQLPPTNFFHKSTDSDGDDDGNEQVEDLESILDECLGAGMNRQSLQWHYRSRHESLITISNVNYYESKLVTFRQRQVLLGATEVVRLDWHGNRQARGTGQGWRS